MSPLASLPDTAEIAVDGVEGYVRVLEQAYGDEALGNEVRDRMAEDRQFSIGIRGAMTSAEETDATTRVEETRARRGDRRHDARRGFGAAADASDPTSYLASSSAARLASLAASVPKCSPWASAMSFSSADGWREPSGPASVPAQ